MDQKIFEEFTGLLAQEKDVSALILIFTLCSYLYFSTINEYADLT